eukprot:5083-Heterococcus_DN1.PRE.1
MAAARMLTMMCTMQLWHIWKEIPAAWCQHWAIAEVTTWQPLQTVRSFDVVHVSSVLCDADLCYSACKAAVASGKLYTSEERVARNLPNADKSTSELKGREKYLEHKEKAEMTANANKARLLAVKMGLVM